MNEIILQWDSSVLVQTINLRREINKSLTMNDISANIAKAHGKKYFDTFRAQIAQFIKVETDLMAIRKKQASITADNATVASVISTSLTATITLVITFFLLFSIINSKGDMLNLNETRVDNIQALNQESNNINYAVVTKSTKSHDQAA